MFSLPTPSQALISLLPLPNDLRELPANDLIRAIVRLTSEYRELVPNFSKQRNWTAFKTKFADYRRNLGIVELSNRLYENDEYPFRIIFHLSFFKDC